MSTHTAMPSLLLAFLCFTTPQIYAQPNAPQQVPAPSDALIETLRRGPQSNTVHWFASTDPKGRNEDYLLLKPNETRRIPLAAGALTRAWCTSLAPDKTTLQLQNGGATIDLLRGGRALQGELYQKAWTFYPTAKTPLTARQLKSDATLIVHNGDAEPNKFFYQASVREEPRNVKALSRSEPDYAEQGDYNVTILPGATTETADGGASFSNNSGFIDEIRIALTPASPTVLSHIRVKMTRAMVVAPLSPNGGVRGNEVETLVDAPLLALVGLFDTPRPVANAMSSFDGKTFILRWPMLYDAERDMLRLNFQNDSSQTVRLACHWKTRSLENPPPYLFHAVYGSARSRKGAPMPILKATGSGFFAGLNLSIAPRKDSMRRTFSFLEGNETIEADGVKHQGTGTEDYFNSAWYYPDAPFDKPFHGMTRKQLVPPQVDAYRLMIPDAVPFSKSLNFTFEHGNRNRDDDLEWRWVAFWYQKVLPQPSTFDLVPPTPKSGFQKMRFEITDSLAQDAARERVEVIKAAKEAKVKADRLRLFGIWGFAALVASLCVLLLRLSSRRPPGARGTKKAS